MFLFRNFSHIVDMWWYIFFRRILCPIHFAESLVMTRVSSSFFGNGSQWKGGCTGQQVSSSQQRICKKINNKTDPKKMQINHMQFYLKFKRNKITKNLSPSIISLISNSIKKDYNVLFWYNLKRLRKVMKFLVNQTNLVIVYYLTWLIFAWNKFRKFVNFFCFLRK